jgi:septum formation inhibitor MinC
MAPAKSDQAKTDQFRTITIRLDEDTLEAAADLLARQIDRAQRVTAAAARELELDETTKDKRTPALAIVKELARAGRLAMLSEELRAGWEAAGDPAAEAARHLELVARGAAAGEPMPRNREEFIAALRADADRVNSADPLNPDQPAAPSELVDAEPDTDALAELDLEANPGEEAPTE